MRFFGVWLFKPVLVLGEGHAVSQSLCYSFLDIFCSSKNLPSAMAWIIPLEGAMC